MRQYCFFEGRFGAYRAPDGANSRDVVVVMCYPAKQESIRVHWCWNLLMDQLALAGFHVFKFDYWGTGDSQGRSEETTFSKGLEDLNLAVQEAKDMSDASEVILLGLRLGANLATHFAGTTAVKGLCLWDPIESGAGYLAELEALHARLPREALLKHGLHERRMSEHLLGYPISEIERTELTRMTVPVLGQGGHKMAILRHSDMPEDYVHWKDNLALEEPIRPILVLRKILELVEAL